jgi:hypothetical protein
MYKKQKSQIHIERIGKAQGIPNVKYVIYPKKARSWMHVAISHSNLKLIMTLAFFGQVREKATVFVQ